MRKARPINYYIVLQSLHKTLPSTGLYYGACTKHVPVLLGTTKLAQSTSQYYLVLQSLHKVLPSTCPVLLCTTKLAQSTSQYYFVLQDMDKVLPRTTLYTQRSFYTHTHREAFTQRSFTPEKLLQTEKLFLAYNGNRHLQNRISAPKRKKRF